MSSVWSLLSRCIYNFVAKNGLRNDVGFYLFLAGFCGPFFCVLAVLLDWRGGGRGWWWVGGSKRRA